MKYKTFRALFWTGVAVAVFGLVALCVGKAPRRVEEVPVAVGGGEPGQATVPEPASAPQQSAEPAVTNLSAEAPQPGTTSPLRELDRRILARLAQGVSGDKVKDAFPAATFKVNLYKDAGYARANRLKIDLDRDEKWDEKWNLDTKGSTPEVERQVAPEDDERYTRTYRLVGDAWVEGK